MTPALILAAAVGGFAVAGCSKSKSKVTAPPAPTTPVANSPANAVALLQWCWQHRALAEYQQLLSRNFSFLYSDFDPIGSAFPGRALSDSQEIAAAQALFEAGVAGLPPARSIDLTLSTPANAVDDPRPGKTAKWHQMVETRFDLAVVTDLATYRTTGSVQYFCVRGDSAAPAADSTRWFLESWREEPPIPTAVGVHPGGNLNPQPTSSTTWGSLKWLYLGSPGGLP